MNIALLQINPTVGDLEGNARLIATRPPRRARPGADLAVTPELALVGYLPRDLLLSDAFVARSWTCAAELARARLAARRRRSSACPSPTRPTRDGRSSTRRSLLRGGRIEQRFRKALLPTYDVFDEDRYFEPFHGAQILELGGRRLGISICEDVWNDRDFWKRRRYHHDPVEELVAAGAQAIVNLSASPFVVGKHRLREEMLGEHGAQARRAARLREPVSAATTTSCSTAGAAAFDAEGSSSRAAARSTPDVVICDLDAAGDRHRRRPSTRPNPKSGTRSCSARATTRASAASRRVVLGLSGGIDSALTAAIAADALGAANVLGVLMPSPYLEPGQRRRRARSWPPTSASRR